MAWLEGEVDREAWYSFRVRADQILELAVRDEGGNAQGTVLVKVIDGILLTSSGHFFNGKYITASDKHYRWWATEGPGRGLSKKALYHLCEVKSSLCKEKKGKQMIIHSERFRLLTPAMIREKAPGWCHTRPCGAEAGPYFEAMLKMEVDRGPKGQLPWLETQEDDDEDEGEESESSTEDEEEENLTDKLETLKKELKAAEARLAMKKAAKSMKKATKASSSKKAKKDKGKDTRRERRVEKGSDDEKPSKKKRSAKEAKSSPQKSKKIKDKEVRRNKKGSSGKASKKDKKKKEGTSSYEEEEEADVDPLFGEAHEDEGEGKKKRKKDRGPFGGGRAMDFDGESESESESKAVFRQAPTQPQAMDQLRLSEYAQRHPGRLAARLLQRMRSEGALGSVGANWLEETRTPPTAVNYFQTVMVPTLGAKLNVRTGRELRTLSVILDHLAREEPARAADIVGQRLKALERSALDGHWMSAQFLELISPDHGSLLERSEEVYVAKQLLLENKLRGSDRYQAKGGKGDQKGGKNRRAKGQGKDPSGKGKEPAPKA
eukprot:Skav219379  [mRNA]  locus=scaffold76:719150:720793:- [translate_table: standard]